MGGLHVPPPWCRGRATPRSGRPAHALARGRIRTTSSGASGGPSQAGYPAPDASPAHAPAAHPFAASPPAQFRGGVAIRMWSVECSSRFGC
eukprot:1184916-Prorocentrum_minimum.AAC.3